MKAIDILNEGLVDWIKDKLADPANPPPNPPGIPNKEISKTQPKPSQDASSDAFDEKVAKIATNLGINKSDLLKIMHFETHGSMSPSKRAGNDPKAAVGLIQFTNATAKGLGTTTAALSKMTAVEQLDYVEKYYKQQKTPRGIGFVGLYMMTYMPGVVTKNKPDDFVLGIDPKSKEWSAADKNAYPFPADLTFTYATNWEENPAFTKVKKPDGTPRDYFTVGDVKKFMQNYSH